jgi:hypothetical protein
VNGIRYEPAAMNRSEAYLAFLPMLTSGKVDLLDNLRLINQFAGLERRTARSGKDSIDSAPTLWIISHTGHGEDAQDRPRGSSALLGAYDTLYRHKKIDERSGEIKITIDRDGLGGKELPFTVELYDTGAVNEDGEPVMVPYLEAAASTVKFTFKKGDEQDRPTPGETLMLKALRAAIRKSDREVGAEDASGDFLEGAKYVTVAEWRDGFRALYKTGSSRQAESQAFAKGRDGLIAKGFVGNRGYCYWPTVIAPN